VLLDPVTMFERAAGQAASVVEQVRPDQLDDPTPCSEWDVRTLIEHMQSGPAYLLAAAGASLAIEDASGARAAVTSCVEALRRPGVLDQRCRSPLGTEWSVAEAAAGTAMDQLVHTWDLAVATGQPTGLDPELVDASIAMFLPHMPALGRAGGLIGPEMAVADGASPQARLLAAMGRVDEQRR
jgi:uncharacterized protein (TIGR03086 family)